MRSKPDEKNKRAVCLVGRRPEEVHSSTAAFFILRRYCKQKALLGASFGSYGGGNGEGLNGEDMGPQGLVAGHAYTVLDAKRFLVTDGSTKRRQKELMLIRLRNPWGRGEWEGAWSDKSPEWKEHPAVTRIIRPTIEDDGAFWMAWSDFERIFAQIDVCARSTGIDDLQLDLNESDGTVANCLGPLKGCCAGCVSFWCCCRGCVALYGHQGGQEATVCVDGDETRAFDDHLTTRVSQMIEDSAQTVQRF